MNRLNKHNVNGYEIMNNLFTGGIQCYFNHNNKKYWADLCYIRSGEIECAIFGFKENGTTDWVPKFKEKCNTISDSNLISCIESFKKN